MAQVKWNFDADGRLRKSDGDELRVRTHAGGKIYATAVHACTARFSAARASRRVESSVGSGEFASLTIRGISVQPRITASHPSSFMRAMTLWKYATDSGLKRA